MIGTQVNWMNWVFIVDMFEIIIQIQMFYLTESSRKEDTDLSFFVGKYIFRPISNLSPE